MNNITTPDAARDRLRDIELARMAAEDAARGTAGRLNGLAQDTDPELRDRLRAEHDRQTARQRQLNVLHSRLRQWLRSLPPGTALEPVPPASARPLKGETTAQAIARLRDEIAAAQSQLRAVRSAPPTKDEIKKLAAHYVQQLAPKVEVDRGVFKASFVNSQAEFGATREDLMAVLAWLLPDAMTHALEREIDALPEERPRMPRAEQERRSAELAASIEQLERHEEALIEMAASEGTEITRRGDASPAAVLGVVVGRRGAAQAA
jgi:hypothetical protein